MPRSGGGSLTTAYISPFCSLGVAILKPYNNGKSYEVNGNNHISVGPWGDQNGARWDDGVYNSVRQMVICHGAAIDSVHIEYDNKGSSVWSEKHGGTGGIKCNKVKLDFPEEYLTSISGHYGSVVEYGPVLVRSLVLESNRKKYGPFGIQHGTHFSLPMSGGRVVGFHGRSSWHLDSIGVYLKPLLPSKLFNNPIPPQNSLTTYENKGHDDFEDEIDKKVISTGQGPSGSTTGTRKTVSYGPWGGNGGQIFDDGVYSGVREVHITRYGGVVSLRVCYDLNGQVVWGNKNGGSGGIRLDKISFDYPSEILTHISGYYGSTILRGPTVVRSLTFYTNKRKYGPFGDEQGISFSSASNNGMIVGFHGRKGWFIDSIGVHVKEGAPLVQLPRPIHRSNYSEESSYTNDVKISEVVPLIVKEPAAPLVLGPWGGGGGKPWDDGIYSGVKKIFLTKGEAIYCVQIEYDRNGQSIWSLRHGGGSEGSSDMIKFEYPSEVLVGVSGYCGSLVGDEGRGTVVKSLTFNTNKRKYGPYGQEMGTFFTTSKTEGKILGFHGRSGCFLNSIGVHMQQWSKERDWDPQGPRESGGGVKTIITKFFN